MDPRPPSDLSEAEHARLLAVIAGVAQHGPEPMARLWEDLASSLGKDTASRLWQEALAASDADQQT